MPTDPGRWPLTLACLCSAQEESGRLSTENSRERAHIDTLEQQLAALRSQLDGQREEAAEAARRQQEAARALELDLTGRLSRVRAQFEAACRDKDKMVLRYAQSEKSVIDAKREAAAADRRVKEAVREKDMLVSKVNHMVQERNRMSQQMEAKVGSRVRASAARVVRGGERRWGAGGRHMTGAEAGSKHQYL